jgi:4-hydroxybenzoate polyprenyltransferase
VAFGALPAYSVLALPGAAVPAPWLVATGSMLGVGAHFFNVLPDIADDRATGVRSLPVRLGATASRWAGCGCLVAAAGVLVLGAPGARRPAGFAGLLLATALAVTAAVAGRQGGRARAPFLLAMLAAAVDLALLVVLVDRGAELG